jgi:hypothetical protein
MTGTKRTATEPVEEERKRARKEAGWSIPSLPERAASLVGMVRETRWFLRRKDSEPTAMALAMNAFLRSQAQMTCFVIEHPSRHPDVPPVTERVMGGGTRTLSEGEYCISKNVLCDTPSLVELCVEAIRHRAREDKSIHRKAEAMLPKDLRDRWFRPCAYTQDPWLSVKWMKLSGCCSSCYYRRTDPEHAEKMSALVQKLERGY